MRKEVLHILMLEDNEFDAELNQEQLLLLEEYDCKIKITQDKEEYIKEITNCPPPDLILCDYNLPRYNGMEALNDLNELKLLIPFIFVTGNMHEEIAADAIKAGAWDYVVKDRLFRLPLAVSTVLKLKKEKDIAVEADKRTKRLLRGIDETSMQVIVIDKDYIIDYVNHNFTKVSGFHPSEILGKTLSSIFSNENRKQKDAIYSILEKKEIYQGDIKIIRANGTENWEHLSITPIFNEKSELRSYILIADNITEQKRLESDLKKSLHELQILNKELEESKKKAEESDNLKTAFLANLSHEIRTPMNGILGFANLIKEENLTPDTIRTYLDVISQSGERMLHLIEDLVDISKIESNLVVIEPQKTDLNILMDEIYNFFKPQAHQNGISFTCEKGLNDSESCVFIDKFKLEQVLTNLLNNAFKFTNEGTVRFNYKQVNNQLIFCVKDTGIGISPGKQKVIFERFMQAENTYLRETEGSGLGLSISKSFVELMGGTVWVESELGKGSEFFISLPFEPLSSETDEINHKPEHVFSNGVTVLVADDDEISYLYIKDVLTKGNYKVLHAVNGKQAVQLFNEIPEVKIILMDLKMPIMNGIDATCEIRKKNLEIPIIAQTGYTSEIDKQKALNAGCSDFIPKPLNKDLLLKKIEHALGHL